MTYAAVFKHRELVDKVDKKAIANSILEKLRESKLLTNDLDENLNSTEETKVNSNYPKNVPEIIYIYKYTLLERAMYYRMTNRITKNF